MRKERLSQTDGVGLLLGAVGTQRLHSNLPIQSMLAWMVLTGAPILHATAIIRPGEQLTAVTWSWTALAGFIYFAIIAAGAGYFLYFASLDRVGAIEINLVAYATPVFAAVGGWLVLGEQRQPHITVGFRVIVLGFTMIKRHAIHAEVRLVKN